MARRNLLKKVAPVVMSEAYVTMMNKDLVDAHCFANNDSFPDFTGIYFK